LQAGKRVNDRILKGEKKAQKEAREKVKEKGSTLPQGGPAPGDRKGSLLLG